MLTRLTERRVFKPWGRGDLPPPFGPVEPGRRLGEIWFEREGRDDPLLVKYLFTSERLSVQVHPGDRAAQDAGHGRGKDEAWVVLDAAPGAEIGVGLKAAAPAERLRAAALDGTIEDMLDWREVAAGDSFYSPAGTIHSIGAGLTLVEVQQNSDVTLRLYDFGRGRELHLDDGLEAVNADSRVAKFSERPLAPGRAIVAQGPKFTLERWTGGARGLVPAGAETPVWLIPVRGTVSAGSGLLDPPGVWLAEDEVAVDVPAGGELLLAYEGERPLPLS